MIAPESSLPESVITMANKECIYVKFREKVLSKITKCFLVIYVLLAIVHQQYLQVITEKLKSNFDK